MTTRRVIPRRPTKPLLDASTDPREWVCLKVAAKYLKMDARTLRSRIEEGWIDATEDKRTVKITLVAIRAYEQHRPVLGQRRAS